MANQNRISAGLKILAFYWLVNGTSSLIQTISFATSYFYRESSYGPSLSLIISNSAHTIIALLAAYLALKQPPFVQRLCRLSEPKTIVDPNYPI